MRLAGVLLSHVKESVHERIGHEQVVEILPKTYVVLLPSKLAQIPRLNLLITKITHPVKDQWLSLLPRR